MSASFPNAVKTFAVRSGGQTIAAAHVNDLQDEVNAIEAALITGPTPPAMSALIGTALATFGTYTPTWTATGSNPAIVNGNIRGRYTQFGKLVFYQLSIGMGSSTTYGTGLYRFSVPVTAAASADMAGGGRLFDAGTGNRLVVARLVSTTTLALYYDEINLNGVGPTDPFTFASGDAIEVSGWYEAA